MPSFNDLSDNLAGTKPEDYRRFYCMRTKHQDGKHCKDAGRSPCAVCYAVDAIEERNELIGDLVGTSPRISFEKRLHRAKGLYVYVGIEQGDGRMSSDLDEDENLRRVWMQTADSIFGNLE